MLAAMRKRVLTISGCCCAAVQNRDYDDEDYVAGVKAAPARDKRGAPLPAAAAGGMVRSGSDVSLTATGAMNKRLKNQMAVKQETAQPRWGNLTAAETSSAWGFSVPVQ